MRSLSIRQPFAYLVAAGIKDIENRTWKTKVRGRIYIHATKRIPLKLFTNLIDKAGIPCYQKELYLEGAIIGEVDITDCVQNYPSIWAEKDCWNWVLANPVLYPEPILGVKGQLSFWEFNK
jgi:hypothetical protein